MFSFPDLATKAIPKDKKTAEDGRRKRKSSQEQTNKDEGASEEPATPAAESGSKKRRGRQRKMEATTPYRLAARMDTNNGNDRSIHLRYYHSLLYTQGVPVT